MKPSDHSQQVNDWLQAGARSSDDVLDLLCECNEPSCKATVTTTRERYLLARDEAGQLLVAAGHEQGDQRVIHAWGEVLVVGPAVAIRLPA